MVALSTRCYVQQQKRGVDCGVFAIAFAVHLALGDDVASLKFDQPRMREHLYKMLASEENDRFFEMRPSDC